MQELKDFYNEWKNRLMVLCIPCWLILTSVFEIITACLTDYIEKCAVDPNVFLITLDNKLYILSSISLLLDFIAPVSIVGVLYVFGLKYVNQKAWKKKFPQYDLSGNWSDMTDYTRGIGENGWIDSDKVSVPSPVIIKQTCLNIEVEASIGEDFMWQSLLAGWSNNNNLKILYEVQYYDKLQERGYPERRVGYESMYICTDNLPEGQCPNKMVGKFWHCISNDGKPMYMGDVTYVRS